MVLSDNAEIRYSLRPMT